MGMKSRKPLAVNLGKKLTAHGTIGKYLGTITD
jgi:hypothetical protein